MREPKRTSPEHRSTFPATEWRRVDAYKLQQEDADSLSDFLDEYSDPMEAYIVNVLGIRDEHLRSDLLQSFIQEKILTRKLFIAADKSRGKFSSLLKVSMANFVRDELRARRRHPLSASEGIDLIPGEVEVDVFERAWAREIVAQAHARMRERCKGNERVFEVWLARSGLKEQPTPLKEIAVRFDVHTRTIKRDFKAARIMMNESLLEVLRDEGATDPIALKEALLDLWKYVAKRG